jgi:oligopeptide/dipeptide ABC transporter ATP-binding protein
MTGNGRLASVGDETPVLAVTELTVSYRTGDRPVRAVARASLEIGPGEAVGLVGESGSGKSTLVRSLVGLLPARSASLDAGRILVEGRDVTGFTEREWPLVRGRPIAMVFQDSLSILNPVMRTDRQIAEAIRLHEPKAAVRPRIEELISLVRLPASAAKAYPFELSGGMRQRVAIAIALACRPRLLIADEPTTALDVTTQAEILELLVELRGTQGMALLLISHDLAVVEQVCERIYVMYAGQVVEEGPARELLRSPGHPYVGGLIQAARIARSADGRFASIEGDVPDLREEMRGCPFAARCQWVMDVCRSEMPPRTHFGTSPNHQVRCWYRIRPLDRESADQRLPVS